jgi:hypothetical protein
VNVFDELEESADDPAYFAVVDPVPALSCQHVELVEK